MTMRMRRVVEFGILGVGLWMAAPQDHPAREHSTQDRPAKAAAPQGQAKPRPSNQNEKRKKPPATAQQKERRRVTNHISAAFPRTRTLLNYLARSDESTFQSVAGHSAKLTRRREAAALRMARQHHPELADLIQRSKRQFPRSYTSAIRELVTDHEKLQTIKRRDPKEFQAALVEWRLRSKVRLVAARMTMDNRPALQGQLERLVTQAENAKRRQIKIQVQRLKAQIQRLERRLGQDPKRSVKRQLRTINNRVGPKRNKTRNKQTKNGNAKKNNGGRKK